MPKDTNNTNYAQRPRCSVEDSESGMVEKSADASY